MYIAHLNRDRARYQEMLHTPTTLSADAQSVTIGENIFTAPALHQKLRLTQTYKV